MTMALPRGLPRWLTGLVWAWCAATAQAGTAAGAAPDCPAAPVPFSAAELQAAEQVPQDHGLLWRIEKDGRASYLYATIHLARREWALPGPQVRAAMQAVDRAAFELNLLDPEVLRRLQRAAQARPGGPRLPAAEARQIEQAAREACVHGSLDGLRPELQVVTLVSLALRREGLDPAWGIDAGLMRRARDLGLPIVSLETPEQQMALMVHDAPSAALAAVRQGLRELGSEASRAVVQRLVTDWAEARLDDLEAFASWCGCQDSDADRAQHHTTVDARNPAMADRIAALHQRGHTVFAAVGALHMIGPAGLPQQMARRGFRVQVLPLDRQ
ncbi:TraB/GumN family protein [uncultured Sphaerotilus sp.]|uniref:TraB/GumN family protein n=1 Tax=uncultured Sphaerotilus sp. TaxID=474984 RepID=UPI0030CA4261